MATSSPNPPAQYYNRLPNGAYRCVICEEIYKYRFDAQRCCHDKKPLADYQAGTSKWHYDRIRNFRPNPHLDKDPGEGIEYPDRNGHWRRLTKDTPKKRRVDYNKAMFLAQSRDYAQLRKELTRLYRQQHQWQYKTSPLQRLSYAYHYGGWEAVKQAAYSLAYSEAIGRRLDALNIPDLIRRELQLERLIKDHLETMSDINAQEAAREIDQILAALELEDFMNTLEQGGDDDASTD